MVRPADEDRHNPSVQDCPQEYTDHLGRKKTIRNVKTGEVTVQWKHSPDTLRNHLLDTCTYNAAVTEHLQGEMPTDEEYGRI